MFVHAAEGFNNNMTGMAPGRGRPRKFNRPSRAVTLTLPEDVIAALTTIDADLSLAVVRTMQQLVPTPERSPAELTVFAGDRAVIVVPRSRALRTRTGVELVPLSDGRALLAFDSHLSVSQFELALVDALADPGLEGEDRLLFAALVDILKNARRNDGVQIGRQNIVVLRWTGSPTRPADSEPAA